jgi:adenine-specific DNA methylase
VKAEMSPRLASQAKEPINLDVIFVCRKRGEDARQAADPSVAAEAAGALARSKLARLQSLGLSLSQNDCRVTVLSQFLALLGPAASPDSVVQAVVSCQDRLEETAVSICRAAAAGRSASGAENSGGQMTLFSLLE